MLHRPKSRLFIGLLTSCIVAMALAPAACGAATTGAAPSTIDATALANVPVISQNGVTAFQGMEVAVINNSSQGGMYTIINGYLPQTATLPAKVQVAVPKGAPVDYIGELSGSTNQNNDISLTIPAPVTQGDQDVYTVTLSKYQTVRVEYATANPFKSSTTTTGTAVQVAKLSYKPLTSLMYLYLGAEVPANAAVLSSDFDNGGALADGGSLYAAALSQTKAGQTYTATLTYAKAGSTKDPTSPLVIIAIVALVVVVAALLFMLLRKRFGGEGVEGE